jgi:hypothetical protein
VALPPCEVFVFVLFATPPWPPAPPCAVLFAVLALLLLTSIGPTCPPFAVLLFDDVLAISFLLFNELLLSLELLLTAALELVLLAELLF